MCTVVLYACEYFASWCACLRTHSGEYAACFAYIGAGAVQREGGGGEREKERERERKRKKERETVCPRIIFPSLFKGKHVRTDITRRLYTALQ